MPNPDPGFPAFGGGSEWEREQTFWTIWADLMINTLVAGGGSLPDTGSDVGLIEGLS